MRDTRGYITQEQAEALAVRLNRSLKDEYLTTGREVDRRVDKKFADRLAAAGLLDDPQAEDASARRAIQRLLSRVLDGRKTHRYAVGTPVKVKVLGFSNYHWTDSKIESQGRDSCGEPTYICTVPSRFGKGREPRTVEDKRWEVMTPQEYEDWQADLRDRQTSREVERVAKRRKQNGAYQLQIARRLLRAFTAAGYDRPARQGKAADQEKLEIFLVDELGRAGVHAPF